MPTSSISTYVLATKFVGETYWPETIESVRCAECSPSNSLSQGLKRLETSFRILGKRALRVEEIYLYFNIFRCISIFYISTRVCYY